MHILYVGSCSLPGGHLHAQHQETVCHGEKAPTWHGHILPFLQNTMIKSTRKIGWVCSTGGEDEIRKTWSKDISGRMETAVNFVWIEWENVDWIRLAQDGAQLRVFMNTVTTSRFHKKLGNLFTSWATVSFSQLTLLHAVNAAAKESANDSDLL
jgi:hypothetical protein